MTDDEIQSLLDAQALTFSNAILALQQRIIDLEAGPTPTPAAAPDPRWWRDRASAEDWDALGDWVDELNGSGSLVANYAIPSCWRRHPGLVEELAAVYESWRDAMVAQQTGQRTGGGSIESSIWFDRALWPVLDRLAVDEPRYQTLICSSGHKPDGPANR